MFSHTDIWLGIDRLASGMGYSPSGLAKKAGLDPTAFNKSKRISPDGKPRWPSTESIAKVLSVTDLTMSDFIGLIGQDESELRGTVAVQLSNGTLIQGEMVKRSPKEIKLADSATSKKIKTYRLSDIDWIARIVWASE